VTCHWFAHQLLGNGAIRSIAGLAVHWFTGGNRGAAMTEMAVSAQAQAVLVTDMGQEHHVAPLAVRRGPVLPGIQPALRHPHQAA
jgi:hypothetical protein